MTRREKSSGGLQAGEFLIGTFGISENNSSPCKQRERRFSNRNKNSISAFEQTPKWTRGIENRRTIFPFQLSNFLSGANCG
jgi:hypothetical protein